MNSAIETLIQGKSKTLKRGWKNNYKLDKMENYLYLLSIDGDTDNVIPQDPEQEWSNHNPKMTYGTATIYDTLTDRVSSCSIYRDKKGLYFKKSGVMYRLDSFK